MTFEHHYQEHGVAVIEWALQSSDLNMMARAFRPRRKPSRDKSFVPVFNSVGGRSPSSEPVSADLADWLETHPVLIEIASRLLGTRARLVAISKSGQRPMMNWFVPWHQDRTIMVAARAPVPSFRGWSRKGNVWQVEPPAELLRQMVTLSIHLDACGDSDGPLEVLPGTHGRGRLRRSEIGTAAAIRAPEVCLADRGDILAISPLTVHRSRRPKTPSRLRIIHLKFSGCDLPAPLAWASLTPELDLID